MRSVRTLFSAWSSVSNSSAFESWLRSPVCKTNSGAVGRALSLSIAARSVAVTSGLAALSNPMCESLICAKAKSPCVAALSVLPGWPNAKDFNTPPCITQSVPVPAQAMHFRNPRRSIPSWFKFSLMMSPIDSLSSGGICPIAAALSPCTYPDRPPPGFIPVDRNFFGRTYVRIPRAAASVLRCLVLPDDLRTVVKQRPVYPGRQQSMKSSYNGVAVPSNGKVIQYSGGKFQVPDQPVIPFIEGDGTGRDIWKASRRVFDAAVEIAYGGKKKIAWLEIFAGEKSFNQFKDWLPQDY